MPPLSWNIDTGSSSTHVMVHGKPDTPSLTALHATLERQCGRRPSCLTIDLSEMSPADHALVTAAALPAQRSSMTSGTAVLLPGTDPAGHPGLRTHLNRHFTQAREALTMGPLRSPSFTDEVLPVSGAARRSRDIVTDACLAWKLPHVIGAAASIISELVSHTIERASTMMTVVVLLHHDVLYLWVRGGIAPNPAQHTDTSLQLLVIHSLADHWGFLPNGDDTVIWAALRTDTTTT